MINDRNQWWCWPAAFCVFAAGLAWLYFFDPSSHGFHPVCLFHAATGLWCPGCGSTRALHQLLHGHLAMAFRFNALLILLIPLLVYALGLRLISGKPAGARDLFSNPRFAWTILAIVIAFGILRNLPYQPCAKLAPGNEPRHVAVVGSNSATDPKNLSRL